MTITELASKLQLTFTGPADAAVLGLRDIERLSEDQSLEDGFVYFIENPAVAKRQPKAAANGIILTTAALAPKFKSALIVPEGQARLAFISLLKLYDKRPVFAPGVSQDARVHPKAKIAASAVVLPGAVVMEGAVVGEGCTLYPGVVIEPFAEIGDRTYLAPGVVIGHHCVIGKDCIIHGGTVIGADGFGFFDEPGKRHKIPHIGNVVLEDFVELGASNTVDRATIETTRVGAYTKCDDQVHIGHNCQVGRFCYIVGNSALGGSVTAADGVMISGMVIIKDHVRLAPGTIVMGMSAIAQDTEPKTAYFGVPARPARQMHKMNAALERLPELLTRVRELEAKLGLTAPDAAA